MHIKRSRGMVRQVEKSVGKVGAGSIYDRRSQIFERAVRYAEQRARDLAQHGAVRVIRKNFTDVDTESSVRV